MPRMVQRLNLTFTDDLRTECIAFLSRITDYAPTLVLMKGARNYDPVERWWYGAYGPDNLRTLGPNPHDLSPDCEVDLELD